MKKKIKKKTKKQVRSARSGASRQKSSARSAPESAMRFKIINSAPMLAHYRILSRPASPLAQVKGWLSRRKVR